MLQRKEFANITKWELADMVKVGKDHGMAKLVCFYTPESVFDFVDLVLILIMVATEMIASFFIPFCVIILWNLASVTNLIAPFNILRILIASVVVIIFQISFPTLPLETAIKIKIFPKEEVGI